MIKSTQGHHMLFNRKKQKIYFSSLTSSTNSASMLRDLEIDFCGDRSTEQSICDDSFRYINLILHCCLVTVKLQLKTLLPYVWHLTPEIEVIYYWDYRKCIFLISIVEYVQYRDQLLIQHFNFKWPKNSMHLNYF